MKPKDSTVTPINSTSDLQQMSQSIQTRIRRSSASSTTQKRNVDMFNQHRHSDFRTQSKSLSFSVPLLMNTMSAFFQATQTMEDEIMLPSRLKDMPVEELVFDSAVQPDNWHEVYTFVRDMRDQLRCTHPFSGDDDEKTSDDKQRKYSDDEGIILPNHDNNNNNNNNNQFSSASSTVSSEEYEQCSTSSVITSYDTIKDQLKFHYYGLFRTLDNLISIADRVTDKYRDESVF